LVTPEIRADRVIIASTGVPCQCPKGICKTIGVRGKKFLFMGGVQVDPGSGKPPFSALTEENKGLLKAQSCDSGIIDVLRFLDYDG